MAPPPQSPENEHGVDLASLVAHELEAPLLSLELELRSLLERTSCREAATRALDQVVALREIAQSLLELGTARVERERFELEPVLARLHQCFLPIAEARRISILRSETRLDAVGDPRATERVLSNLLDNAIKVSPAGGRVRLTAGSTGGKVTISVSDDGPGLEASARDEIFEPFFRLDRESPGSGLGLTLARRLAELQEGRILVASEPGEGSRFTLELALPQP